MDKNEIIEAYRHAKNRLLLLDYDGVLAPIMPLPEQAAPSKKTYQLLKELAEDGRNTCVVISGRPHDTLEEWLGSLPLAFAAEHGLWRRELRSSWEFARSVSTDWKPAVKEVMQRYEHTMSGSFIEEKYAGLALHYRNVTLKDTSSMINLLLRDLEPLAAQLKLTILNGKKVVEVIPDGIDKGTAAKFWLGAKKWDFILGAGDDETDEALFKQLPPTAYSIKIGKGITHAKGRIELQSDFMRLLAAFAEDHDW